MKYYPINLNIENKRCVVIGGGKVAERKTKTILKFKGIVTLISPEITSYLKRLVTQKKIKYKPALYTKGDLKGGYLIYAATSNRKTNAQIAKNAKKLGLEVNVCDSKEESTFILPAILLKKDLTISVGSGGKSPKKSVALRNKIKTLLKSK